MVPNIVLILLAFIAIIPGCFAMLIFDLQMLWTGMIWTDRNHVLVAQEQETTIRVSCDT